VVEEYPDLETLLRGYLAHGSIVTLVRSAASGRYAARSARECGRSQASGGVRIRDEYRYLIAPADRRAPIGGKIS
jgi:hypothetical protein